MSCCRGLRLCINTCDGSAVPHRPGRADLEGGQGGERLQRVAAKLPHVRHVEVLQPLQRGQRLEAAAVDAVAAGERQAAQVRERRDGAQALARHVPLPPSRLRQRHALEHEHLQRGRKRRKRRERVAVQATAAQREAAEARAGDERERCGCGGGRGSGGRAAAQRLQARRRDAVDDLEGREVAQAADMHEVAAGEGLTAVERRGDAHVAQVRAARRELVGEAARAPGPHRQNGLQLCEACIHRGHGN